METVGSVGTPLAKRKIAFCVAKWADTSAVLSWAWLRQYFLHVRSWYHYKNGCLIFQAVILPNFYKNLISAISVLLFSLPLQRETDELIIFHTGKSSNWKAGGPLGPDLDTALQHYPHQVITVSGTLQSSISKLVKAVGIDVVVLGEDFPRQSGFQIGSVSDWVRQNITCPFIIIRASAVRNDKLRLGSRSQFELLASPGRPLPDPVSPESAPGRKVAIAYSSYSVGTHLMELAKQLVLLPQDEIFVVHCFSGEKSVMKQTKSLLLRTITLGLADSSSSGPSAIPSAGTGGGTADDLDRQVQLGARKMSLEEVTEESSLEFGAKELAGWENVHLGVVLRGDPRTALTTFCESEGIELLVISTRIASFIRKTLTGGSVSGYLIDKAPCPCLVAPLKSLNVSTEDEEGPLSPSGGSGDGVEWGIAGGTGGNSPVSSLPPPQGQQQYSLTSVEALQAQLAEKDKLIEVLRDEVARLRLAAAENNLTSGGGVSFNI
jgi:nucleotide-binding universal stress UspA family protein